MAGGLKSFGVRKDISVISFLVVSTSEFSDKITVGLHKSATASKCRIVVHQCESVSEVVRKQKDLHVDFIIFAFDSKVEESLNEVEDNITLVAEYFIVSGRCCLVNGNDIRSAMEVTSERIWAVRKKYNLRFFTADVSDPEDCLDLGHGILNLASAALGIKSGLPILDYFSRYQQTSPDHSEQ